VFQRAIFFIYKKKCILDVSFQYFQYLDILFQIAAQAMRPPLAGPYAIMAQDAKGCCHLHARTAAITAAVYSLVSMRSPQLYID
jgi:hypothetical protein